ncbi:MAG: HAD family phosphatase [Treponema sp.]|jgi:putative hydrolase of the HAD superfamily|nr:HAD family phosphatase [Treponema sp.]
MIYAVVFDYGRVISFSPPETVIEGLASLGGIDVKTMETLMWKHRDIYDRGTCSGKDFYRFILEKAGAHPQDQVLEEMARIDMDSWTHVNPETVRLMEEVKAAGLKLGILSNMPWDFLDLARKTIPLFKLPSIGIFSCELGLIKPEAAIYQKLIEALQCKPEETVFFDDVKVNVEKAQEQGIKAAVWEGPEEARIFLRCQGLAF